ncbi:hypothetical protein [Herbiconiux sp.]|uniref:hypothetical protein n=1 Tax=Herbiconiux sp. TaxID=1871186 RepID=UPI0025C53DF0|nr:hypothetical protein [Herbiconiux sp.]
MSESSDIQRTSLFGAPVLLAGLRRLPLEQGRGGVREIWAGEGPHHEPRWQLRIVDMRGPRGILSASAGSEHYVIGLAGPQVAVGDTRSSGQVLRRGRVVPIRSATVVFERPKLRAAGASSLVVLTASSPALAPTLTLQTVEGAAVMAAGTCGVVTLRHGVLLDDADVPGHAATLIDPRGLHRIQVASAQVLTLVNQQQP